MKLNEQMTLSRRDLIKGALAGTGASLLGWTSLFGINKAFAQETSGENDDVQTIINLASTAELFATTHYLAAINAVEAGDLDLDDIQLAYLKAGFIAEQDHYELLLSLGATPVVTEFYVPDGLFSDVEMFAAITEVAETTFVSAYLAATRIFVELGETAFAVTTAQIAGVEAEHRALIRQIGKSLPNNQSYAQFQFDNVSGAVPTLQPFLDGSGDGFVGPVAAPTDDQVAAIRSQAGDLGYTSDILPYAAIAASQTSSSMDGMVTVTAFDADVNIRQSPSTTATVVGVLSANTSVSIDGQRQGDDGFIWWRVTDGGWVRSDTVSEASSTDGIPNV